jgi:hypothetical protein
MWRILPPVEKSIMEIPVKEGPREDLAPGPSRGLCVLFNARHSRPGKSADRGYHLLKKIPLCAAPGGKKYCDYITLRQKPR